MTQPESFILKSIKDTQSVAHTLAGRLAPMSVVALYGPIGAGKTTFTQHLAQSLGIHTNLTSPTFTIINEYEGNVTLYHMDWYRIDSPEELFNLNIEDYFDREAITVIEWPERAEQLLPPRTIRIIMNFHPNSGKRSLSIESPQNKEQTNGN